MGIPGLDHLPALPVLIPLLAAPFAVVMPAGRAPWVWATLVSWVTFIYALLLLAAVWDDGAITYEMGGWAAPLGITYYIDPANALVIMLVSAMAAVVFPYAYFSVKSEISREQSPAFYTALMICLTGLLGVAATGDAFNVFVFLEISSLSTYALIAMGARRDRRALTASFNYLVMGTIGATFYVIGLGLLYQATGTLNMLDLHDRLTDPDNVYAQSRVVQAAFAFIVTGIGLKLAMVPLHLWLPNAYSFAPSAVTAFLAATATKVQLYVMARFLFTVFGFDFPFLDVALNAFLILGLAGMFYASLVAVFRDNVKQLLAYSSVAQIGYILLGFSFGTVEGITASFVHIFNHAIMKAALFMAVGCVVLRIGSSQLTAFRGLARRMPWTTWALVLSGLSLIGVPPTVGFISKFKLMEAAFATSTIVEPLVVVLMIGASSLLAAVYVGRLIYTMVLEQPPEDAPVVAEAPFLMRIALWLMVLANFYFFFQTDLTVGVAAEVAVKLICNPAGCGGAY